MAMPNAVGAIGKQRESAAARLQIIVNMARNCVPVQLAEQRRDDGKSGAGEDCGDDTAMAR